MSLVLRALQPIGWAEQARARLPVLRGWTAAEVLARAEGLAPEAVAALEGEGPEPVRRRRALGRVHAALRALAAAGRCRRRERRVQAELAGKGQRWVVVEVYF